VLRIPRCLDNRLTDGGEVASLTRWPRSTTQKHTLTLTPVSCCHNVFRWLEPPVPCSCRYNRMKCEKILDTICCEIVTRRFGGWQSRWIPFPWTRKQTKPTQAVSDSRVIGSWRGAVMLTCIAHKRNVETCSCSVPGDPVHAISLPKLN
jgi:hypothetical protein